MWEPELRGQPTDADITAAVKVAENLPDAGDKEHVLAMYPILGKKLPAIPDGSWGKHATQKVVKFKNLQATNQQLNRANLVWHLKHPGQSRMKTPHNTAPQVLKTKDGDYAIVDGHHRLSALKMLGVKKDLCWVLDQKDL